MRAVRPSPGAPAMTNRSLRTLALAAAVALALGAAPTAARADRTERWSPRDQVAPRDASGTPERTSADGAAGREATDADRGARGSSGAAPPRGRSTSPWGLVLGSPGADRPGRPAARSPRPTTRSFGFGSVTFGDRSGGGEGGNPLLPGNLRPGGGYTPPRCAWVVIERKLTGRDPSGRAQYVVREQNSCTGAIREIKSY